MPMSSQPPQVPPNPFSSRSTPRSSKMAAIPSQPAPHELPPAADDFPAALESEARWILEGMALHGATASSCVRAVELLCATVAASPDPAALLSDCAQLRARSGACLVVACKVEGVLSVDVDALAPTPEDREALHAQEETVLRAVDCDAARPTGWTHLETAMRGEDWAQVTTKVHWDGETILPKVTKALTAAKALLLLLLTTEPRAYCSNPAKAAEGVLVALRAALDLNPKTDKDNDDPLARAYAGAALRQLRKALAAPALPFGERPNPVLPRPDFRAPLRRLARVAAKVSRAPAVASLEAEEPPVAAEERSTPALELLRLRFCPREAGRKERTVTVLDHVKIKSRLGAGAYGKVYRVREVGVPDHYAVKEVPAHDVLEPDALTRSAVAELAAHRAVSGGPGILPMLWWRKAPRSVFIATPMYPMTLHERLKHPMLTEAAGRAVLRKLSEGVAYVHSRGILHLDVKSANVLLDPAAAGPGGEPDVRLCDFSISETWDAGAERPVRGAPTVGSLWYRAPELIAGCGLRLPALDVWAVGCVGIEVAANVFCGLKPHDSRVPLRCAGDAEEEAQLRAYFAGLGFPNVECGGGGGDDNDDDKHTVAWPELAHTPLYRNKIEPFWHRAPRKAFGELLPGISEPMEAFLRSALVYRPQWRASAAELAATLLDVAAAAKVEEEEGEEGAFLRGAKRRRVAGP